MANDPLDNTRRENRRPPCNVDPFLFAKRCEEIEERRKVRPTECPEELQPDLCIHNPDDFRAPQPPPPAPPVPAVFEEPEVVGNEEVTVTCETLFNEQGGTQFGFDATSLPCGAAPVTGDELSYLTGSPVTIPEDTLTRTLPVLPENPTRKEQAEYEANRLAVIAELTALAQQQAFAQLQCSVGNAEVTFSCADLLTEQNRTAEIPDLLPDGSYGPGGSRVAVNTVTIAANTITSTSGLVAATEQACAMARAGINCLFGNSEATAQCEKTDADSTYDPPTPEVSPGDLPAQYGAGDLQRGPGSIVTFDDPVVPNTATWTASGTFDRVDVIDHGSGATGVTRIGTGVTEQNFVISPVSKAIADTIAQSLAESVLACNYVNIQRQIFCSDDENGVPVAETASSEVNPVTIPEGTVSAPSQIQADNIALQQALGQLICFWESEDGVVSCPPQCAAPFTFEGELESVGDLPGNPETNDVYLIGSTFYGWDGTEWVEATNETVVDLLDCRKADPALSTGETAFPPVRSFVSQQEANDQAELIATTLLTCVYCNKEVPDFCVLDPNDPLPPGDTEFHQYHNARSAIEDRAFCLPVYQSAKDVAESVHSIPDRLRDEVNEEEECFWINDEIRAKCVDPTEPVDPMDPQNPNDPEDEHVYKFAYDETLLDQILDNNQAIVIPAGTVQSNTSKSQANDTAEQLALGALACFFTNEDTVGYCIDPQCAPNSPGSCGADPWNDPEAWVDIEDWQEGTDSACSGVDIKKAVPAADEDPNTGPGTESGHLLGGASYPSYVCDPDNLNNLRVVKDDWGYNQAQSTIGEIPEGTVVSEDPETATNIARELAQAQTLCLYGNRGTFLRCALHWIGDATGGPGSGHGGGQGFIPELSAEPSIPSNTFFASSRGQADEIADNIAAAQFRCAYANAERCAEDCDEDEGFESIFTSVGGSMPTDRGNDPEGFPLDPFDKPCFQAGVIVSYVSHDDANKQATEIANIAQVCVDAQNIMLGGFVSITSSIRVDCTADCNDIKNEIQNAIENDLNEKQRRAGTIISIGEENQDNKAKFTILRIVRQTSHLSPGLSETDDCDNLYFVITAGGPGSGSPQRHYAVAAIDDGCGGTSGASRSLNIEEDPNYDPNAPTVILRGGNFAGQNVAGGTLFVTSSWQYVLGSVTFDYMGQVLNTSFQTSSGSSPPYTNTKPSRSPGSTGTYYYLVARYREVGGTPEWNNAHPGGNVTFNYTCNDNVVWT